MNMEIILPIVTFILGITIAPYLRRTSELKAEEKANDREHLKKTIRNAVKQTKEFLAELRISDLNTVVSREKIIEINSVIEDLELVDKPFSIKIWQLANTPSLYLVAQAQTNTENGRKFLEVMRGTFYDDLKGAFKRCSELERDPGV